MAVVESSVRLDEHERIRAMSVDELVALVVRKRGVVSIDGRGGSTGQAKVSVSVESADGRARFEADRSDRGRLGRSGAQLLLSEAVIECYEQAVTYAGQRATENALSAAW